MADLSHFMSDPLGKKGTEPWVNVFLEKKLPPEWEQVRTSLVYAISFKHKVQPFHVIIAGEAIGRERYVHLQMSHKDRQPTLEEVHEIKDTFFGPSAVAYQILVPKDQRRQMGVMSVHLWLRALPMSTEFHVPAGKDEEKILERSQKTEAVKL